MVRFLGVCVAVHFRDFEDDNYSYRFEDDNYSYRLQDL